MKLTLKCYQDQQVEPNNLFIKDVHNNKKFLHFKQNSSNNFIINNSQSGKTKIKIFKYPINSNKNLMLSDRSHNIILIQEGITFFYKDKNLLPYYKLKINSIKIKSLLCSKLPNSKDKEWFSELSN